MYYSAVSQDLSFWIFCARGAHYYKRQLCLASDKRVMHPSCTNCQALEVLWYVTVDYQKLEFDQINNGNCAIILTIHHPIMPSPLPKQLLIQFSSVSIHWHVFPGTTKDIVMSASASSSSSSSSRVKLHKRCEDFRRLEGDQSFPLLLCVFWLQQQHNDEIHSNFYPLLSKSMVNVYPSVLFLHTITMLVYYMD